MKKLLLTLIASVFTVFAANAIQLGDRLLLTAKLTGDQESPAVTTNAVGVASFLLNASHDSLCVNVTVTGLSGPITNAHIHSGAVGVSGPAIKDLTSFVSGNTIKTVIYGTDLSAHLKEYLSAALYINVHTSAHADGEIRGQIYLETDWSFVTSLDGSQLVPVSNTAAYGLGVFNLSKDSSKIKYNVIIQGASGAITEARLNYGMKGVNGAIALSITSGINGNLISGVISNPTPALIDSLRHSKVYLDLSTATHTAGTELRGQLINENKYLYFDAFLNGQQEVPVITTPALGVASIKLNATYDTLWYDVVSNGLSGTITNAHFHLGAPGVSGGVEISIIGGLLGNRITGKIVGASLTNDFVKKLLRGDLYINLHTTLNANGEIRGQVYRVARQGYTINLDGAQETPPVTTNAKGTGIVSIDRDSDNAHFMLVADGLVPTAGHFHKQIAGQSGPDIFNLLPYYTGGGAFGYWKSSNATTPFTAAIANAFNKDSIYANVHTTLNANGEIRGQVIKRGECFTDISTGIDNQDPSVVNGIVLYPNPSTDLINISFESTVQTNVTFEIIDVLGKQVHAEGFTAQVGNNLHSVFISKLKNGLYFVKIQNGNVQTIERFVKK